MTRLAWCCVGGTTSRSQTTSTPATFAPQDSATPPPQYSPPTKVWTAFDVSTTNITPRMEWEN